MAMNNRQTAALSQQLRAEQRARRAWERKYAPEFYAQTARAGGNFDSAIGGDASAASLRAQQQQSGEWRGGQVAPPPHVTEHYFDQRVHPGPGICPPPRGGRSLYSADGEPQSSWGTDDNDTLQLTRKHAQQQQQQEERDAGGYGYGYGSERVNPSLVYSDAPTKRVYLDGGDEADGRPPQLREEWRTEEQTRDKMYDTRLRDRARVADARQRNHEDEPATVAPHKGEPGYEKPKVLRFDMNDRAGVDGDDDNIHVERALTEHELEQQRQQKLPSRYEMAAEDARDRRHAGATSSSAVDGDAVPLDRSYNADNLYNAAVRVGPPHVQLADDDALPPPVVQRVVTRQIEVPYARRVRVPVKQQKLVPVTVMKQVKMKKLVEVPAYQFVSERYTEYEERELTRDKEVWTKQLVPEKYIARVPVVKYRQVKKPLKKYKRVTVMEEVPVVTNKLVEVDGFRVDEVEDSKLVEVEELQDYELRPVATGPAQLRKTTDLGRITHRHHTRRRGHDVVDVDDPSVRNVPDEDDVEMAYRHKHPDDARAHIQAVRETRSSRGRRKHTDKKLRQSKDVGEGGVEGGRYIGSDLDVLLLPDEDTTKTESPQQRRRRALRQQRQRELRLQNGGDGGGFDDDDDAYDEDEEERRHQRVVRFSSSGADEDDDGDRGYPGRHYSRRRQGGSGVTMRRASSPPPNQFRPIGVVIKNTHGHGVIVTQVSAHSPADVGGICEGDAIAVVNSTPVYSIADFRRVCDGSSGNGSGGVLTMQLRRARGQRATVTVDRRTYR